MKLARLVQGMLISAAFFLFSILLNLPQDIQAALVMLGACIGCFVQSKSYGFLFSPINQLLVFWLMCGVLNPALSYFVRDTYRLVVLNTNSLLLASVLCAVGMHVFTLGYSSAESFVKSKSQAMVSKPIEKKFPITLEISLLIVWLLSTVYLVSKLGFNGILRYRSPETISTLVSVEKYPIYASYLLIYPAVHRLLYSGSNRRNNLIAYIYLAAASLLPILSGGRLFFIPIIIAVLLTRTSLRLTYPEQFGSLKSRYIAGSFLIVSAVVFMRSFRQSFDERFLSLYGNSTIDNLIITFAGPDTKMLSNFSRLLDVSEQFKENNSDLFYWRLLSLPIPRSWWESKPYSFDFDANIFIGNYGKGYGSSFTFFAEAYFSGGILILILVSLIFGIACRIVYSSYLNPSSISSLAFQIVVISQLIVFYRGSLTADFPRIVLAVLPFVVMKVLQSGQIQYAKVEKQKRVEFQ